MWSLIELSKDPAEYESFLRAFPNSQFVPIARLKLKRLKGSYQKDVKWVTDKSTDINWGNINSRKKLTWDKAISHCNNLTLGGVSYWRLPTIAELVSLYESNIKEELKINGKYWGSDIPRTDEYRMTTAQRNKILETAHFLDFDSRVDKMLYEMSGLGIGGLKSIKKSNYNFVICVNEPYNDDQLRLHTFSSGATYLGEWKNDKMEGQGTYTWLNGDKYVGEWKDGDMNGQGILTQARNGHKHVGEFKLIKTGQ